MFQSPNTKPGQHEVEIKSFKRMNGAEISNMIRNWLCYPNEGLDAATAERLSLETLRYKVGQLFHMQGGLDIAQTALSKYESYRFDKSWTEAMERLQPTLDI